MDRKANIIPEDSKEVIVVVGTGRENVGPCPLWGRGSSEIGERIIVGM